MYLLFVRNICTEYFCRIFVRNIFGEYFYGLFMTTIFKVQSNVKIFGRITLLLMEYSYEIFVTNMLSKYTLEIFLKGISTLCNKTVGL